MRLDIANFLIALYWDNKIKMLINNLGVLSSWIKEKYPDSEYFITTDVHFYFICFAYKRRFRFAAFLFYTAVPLALINSDRGRGRMELELDKNNENKRILKTDV